MPASAIRLAVPSVFDRLDGTVTLEARLTGSRDAPSIVGTGHLENGMLSFIGYGQLFEGVRADAVLSREKVVFEHFEAKSGGGYVDGWGEVPLKMDAGQRLYFSVDFLDMRFPYPDISSVVQGPASAAAVDISGHRTCWCNRPATRIPCDAKNAVRFGRRLSAVSARREKSDFPRPASTAPRAEHYPDQNKCGRPRRVIPVVGDSSVDHLGSFDVVEGSGVAREQYECKRAGRLPGHGNIRCSTCGWTMKGTER